MSPNRSLYQSLFEPKTIDGVAPVSKVFSYLILGFWAMVCLFPLYWLVVTSLKLPIHVNDGPVYLPGIDFKPSLHAWKYIFVDLGNDTLRPYLNTVLVSLASSVIAVVIGSMAGYALTRIAYRPKLGSILMFILIVASTWWFGLWSNLVTLINLFISSLVASSIYQPIATELENINASYRLLYDFIAVWLVFVPNGVDPDAVVHVEFFAAHQQPGIGVC